MKTHSFIKGALIISIASFVAKMIGGFYKIPLTNMIGSYGMGMYQLVYPLYCLLLTLSAIGLPTAISKIVSSSLAVKDGYSPKKVLKKCLLLFGCLGLLGSVLMAVLSGAISDFQTNPNLKFSYLALSPSVFIVSLISCFKGYFQGQKNMTPSALCDVIEQIVKAILGLFFASYFLQKGYSVVRILPFILLSVTVSEAISLMVMLIFYRKSNTFFLCGNKEIKSKQILAVSLPITISVILTPLSSVLDSVLIVRGLSYMSNATSLYGLFSGCALTIINLPVSICYGVAVSIVPILSTYFAKGEMKKANDKILLAFKITSLIALPTSIFILFYPTQIVSFLFRNLPVESIAISSTLLKNMWLVPFCLANVQTLSSCLAGIGKTRKSIFALLIGIIAKTIIILTFIRNENYNIQAGAFATFVCYLIAGIFVLLYSIKGKNLLSALTFIMQTAIISIISVIFVNQISSQNIIVVGIAYLLFYGSLSYLLAVFNSRNSKSLVRVDCGVQNENLYCRTWTKRRRYFDFK